MMGIHGLARQIHPVRRPQPAVGQGLVSPWIPIIRCSSFLNIVATPHISGSTFGTSKRRAACVAENLDRLAKGLEPLYRVDNPRPQPAPAGRD